MRFTPSKEDKAGWSKLAQWAYKEGHNDIGHAYSSFAAYRNNDTMSESAYTIISNQYQDWLYFGWLPNVHERVKL